MGQILLNGIVKSYGKEVVVKNLDLIVEPGEFLTILGPSGCGKTTTLRMIAGLEEPDQGTIKLDDRVVFSRNDGVVIPPEARHLGLIFQSYALWPHMTVAKNITLALKEQKISKDEISNRLKNALEMVQLTGYAERYPSELSGGQQQRVAVARLIALRPTILLMDEPLSNLDAKLRSSVRKDIKKLQRDLGITVVYVTHDQTEAMSMADKVVLMKDGRVQQIGTPNELYNHPENTFVAEFIGAPAMALMDSYLIDGIKNGNKIGLRAENITIVPDGEGRLSCSVSEAEFLGSETLIGLEHEGTIGLNVLQPGLSIVPSGQKIDITFDDQDLHTFNSAGERINGQ